MPELHASCGQSRGSFDPFGWEYEGLPSTVAWYYSQMQGKESRASAVQRMEGRWELPNCSQA